MDRTSTVGGGLGARVVGVDVARALALIGMMLIHVLPRIDESSGEATVLGLTAAGRSAALFALLAGVGLALLTGGHRPHRERGTRSRDRRLVVVRALLIVVIGFVVAAWESQVAIILVHYGLLFLLAVPLLGLGARALAAIALGWVLLAPPLLRLVITGLMTDPDYPGEMRLWHSPGLPDLLTRPGLLALDLSVTGYYPLLIWPAYLIAGLAVGRCDLSRRSVAWTLLGLGAGLAALSAAVSWATLLGTDLVARLDVYGDGPEAVRAELLTGTLLPVAADPRWFLVAAPHSGSTADLVHTIGSALLVLGACLLVASVLTGRRRLLLAPLIGAGAMPLTLYVGHLALLHAWHVEGWPLHGADPATIALGLIVAALAGGGIKAALRRRGPLEAGVHAAGIAAAGRHPS